MTTLKERASEIPEKKEWFKNICPNKHENYRVICEALHGEPSGHTRSTYRPSLKIVKVCHDCGATAQLGSSEWTRKA